MPTSTRDTSRHSPRLRSAVAATEDPIERLLAVFDAQARLFHTPGFRGCAFAAAAAEAPAGGRIDATAESYRHDIHTLFTELADAAGAPDPALLASQLQLIYDGGGLAAKMDRNPDIATPARAAASALIAAALQDDRRRRRLKAIASALERIACATRLYTGMPIPGRGGRVAEGTRLLSEYGGQTPSRVRIPPSPLRRTPVNMGLRVRAAAGD